MIMGNMNYLYQLADSHESRAQPRWCMLTHAQTEVKLWDRNPQLAHQLAGTGCVHIHSTQPSKCGSLYKLIIQSPVPTDIDECEQDIHDCHTNAVCINNVGSFTCQCSDGFQGNGRNCTGLFCFILILGKHAGYMPVWCNCNRYLTYWIHYFFLHMIRKSGY